MSRSKQGEGTKIAQAAKDLNVTSVTIRRYISEFNIETTADENGIKVLPAHSMEELHEIRKLKEDGMTNPKVLEHLEDMRSKAPAEKPAAKGKKAAAAAVAAEPEAPVKKVNAKRIEPAAKAEPPAKKETTARRVERKVVRKEEDEVVPAAPDADEEDQEEEVAPGVVSEEGGDEKDESGDELGEGKSKHTLTCQTCSKTFEHMNPRLRDCLECYRAKRKERRRGGDKHKNVIQHPLAQQVTNKQQRGQSPDENGGAVAAMAESTIDASPMRNASAQPVATPLPLSSKRINPLSGMQRQAPVRNYRKAIEETRGITSNLKRRLERPDLPENERRWLEQIYAYQLILHQGWRHLAEYKAGNQPQKPQQD
jgi:DNA-binding transcriptional MerR regulator